MYRFDLLKEERERLGYSQTAFAAMVASSKQAQINWEKGIASPNATALAVWANVGLDVLYVVTGDRSFVPPPKYSAKVQLLIEFFEQAPEATQKKLLRMALDDEPAAGTSASAPAPSMGDNNINNNQSGMTMTNSAPGGVQVGFAGGRVSVKKGR